MGRGRGHGVDQRLGMAAEYAILRMATVCFEVSHVKVAGVSMHAQHARALPLSESNFCS